MSLDAARFTKAQASSAWIGAALLLFFGFGYMTEPSGTDLFSKAAWVFYQTLRIGGIAMAASAAFLTTGHTLALLIDAFVSITVGLLLIATGVVMFVDGGEPLQPIINVVCGAGFASSGRRSWSAYANCASDRSSPTPHTSNLTPRRVDAPPPLPRGVGGDQGGSLPGALSTKSSDTLPPSNLELPTSPSGYLSALADKRRRDRGDSSS